MDRREGANGVTGGESRQEDSQGTGGEHFRHSDDKSGSGQQAGRQDVAPEAASTGSSSRIEITSMEELRDAIKRGNLSQVTNIDLDDQKIGSGHFTVAEALASGQMSALGTLWLANTGLEDDRSEAISNALASAKFPSLSILDFRENAVGTKGVEALGRAIQSGNLEKLTSLNLWETGINDDDMATLATAFQYGDVTVMPNLESLHLTDNRFTDVGLLSLVAALKSGRLDSLHFLGMLHSNPSEERATALVSAFALNQSLTVEVWFDWSMFPELERQYEQLRKRNTRYKDILAGLSGSSMVPAAFGKIYLCGDPKMGKTTLRHTLKRTLWQSLGTWERRPHVETRTRGIDVSKIGSKGSKRKDQNPITLLVWDMAGQKDYHLVHNAFFPALSVSEGKATISQGAATIFVIVCNSSCPPDEVEKQLDYWLRYIASSSHEAAKQIRHVFVVLNNMGGDKEVKRNCQYWEVLLQEKRDKFTGLLDVRTDPFIVDVRRRGKVNRLKTRLLEHSRTLLKEQIVPKICDVVQKSLPIWSEAKKGFPVLGWEEFLENVEQLRENWPHETILSATKHLDEAGVVIYVDKKFPGQWGIPSPRLIILNPNWFCKEIIGNMFLSEDMVKHTEGDRIFRKALEAATGSISMSDFKKFFTARWGPKDCEDLIAILLWLGLCYKGKEDKVFIPSLIDENLEPEDAWQSHSKHEDGEEQWVMGFSIRHQENEMTLAPMSLWHRFQVQLAQSRDFNNRNENDFVAGKYSMTFTVDNMNVRIEVNAGKDSPTFDEINIFVKPFEKDQMDILQRKQCQVNLADDLVNILLDLWNEICGGVKYVRNVVWPWPVSQFRPVYKKDRNAEVAEVKKWVLMHGMGRKMHWLVGRDSAISEDQLLATKEKLRVMIMSAKNDLDVLRQGMQEAVNLGIYPPELTEESEISIDGNKVEEAALVSDEFEMANPPTRPTAKKMQRLSSAKKMQRLSTVNRNLHNMDHKMDKNMNNQDNIYKQVKNVDRKLGETFAEVLRQGMQEAVYLGVCPTRLTKVTEELEVSLDGNKMEDAALGSDRILNKLENVEMMLRDEFAEVLNERKMLFRRLQDSDRFFKEDTDRTCPNLLYLGKSGARGSGVRATLRESISPTVNVRLQFACEAMYGSYIPHQVEDQHGHVVSEPNASLKLVPWLKVSLTVLLISAKIAKSVVATGAGLLLPDFQELQQGKLLLDGIVWATGYSMPDLDALMTDGMALDPSGPPLNPRDVYRKSRAAIENLIDKLTQEAFEDKFRLRKVCLADIDGSRDLVVWICAECHEKFRESKLVIDM